MEDGDEGIIVVLCREYEHSLLTQIVLVVYIIRACI